MADRSIHELHNSFQNLYTCDKLGSFLPTLNPIISEPFNGRRTKGDFSSQKTLNLCRIMGNSLKKRENFYVDDNIMLSESLKTIQVKYSL